MNPGCLWNGRSVLRGLLIWWMGIAAGFCQSSFPVPDPAFEPLRFGDPTTTALVPFFPGARYRPDIVPPDAVIGQPLGTRPAHPDEILRCLERLAASDRVAVTPYARSHEGRLLVQVRITLPEYQARWEEIQADLQSLADPRRIPDGEDEALLGRVPAVAWMGYSIHGDELSGCDASLALAYHLAASEDAEVLDLLREVAVVIDPCQNPDGRARIVALVEQGAGATPSSDPTSMQRGRWPYGRGNHYLFDMNRDWMAGTQPETRGRWGALLEVRPHLLIDAHEMGSLDTYLFYPQSAPHNPFLPERLAHWHQVFGGDQARAFDAHGWAYYTREWADGWAPFYSDAWGSLNGAIGILYEQASTAGFPLRRASGAVLTYRESVHHQLVSSVSNLRTLQRHREAILRDYLGHRRANLRTGGEAPDTLAWIPGTNHTRERKFLEILLRQGIEVEQATAAFPAEGAQGTLGDAMEAREFPPGARLVRVSQPQRPLVENFLRFDVPIPAATLQAEREELERRSASKLYDATAWSLPLALGLDAWWCRAPSVDTVRIRELPPSPPARPAAEPSEPESVYAWVVDGAPDDSVRFAAQAMAAGIQLHLARKPFEVEGGSFSRGSLIVRRLENSLAPLHQLDSIAQQCHVNLSRLAGGRAQGDSADLGGGFFDLLERPRVALLGNHPVAEDTYGHLWHVLDRDLGLEVSLLDAAQFESYDLRPFNVLVLPPASGEIGSLLRGSLERLRTWVEGGGTLIACGSTAAELCAPELDLVKTRLRSDRLDDLEAWREAVARERAAYHVTVDPAAVYGPVSTPGEEPTPDASADRQPGPEPFPEEQDEWMRRFSPSGVFVRAEVDDESWCTIGCAAEIPWYVSGSHALLSQPPARTPIRLAPAAQLRLSGLLWPEARERLGGTGAVVIERRGNGQVILFAVSPAFRGHVQSSARTFANAVVYGPGRGAQPPLH